MDKTKNKKNIGIIILSVILIIIAGIIIAHFIKLHYEKKNAYDVKPLYMEQLDKIVTSETKKLMIVAHPDDDVIWGGGHLMSGGYLVVCVTNGRNDVRRNEFIKVITSSGNVPLILEYPDKVGDERDSWEKVWDKISSDLGLIMTYKNWNEIVCHNKEGEYDHIHHRNVHALVTEIYDKYTFNCPLYCFGKYYKKSQIDSVKSELKPLSDKEYKFKLRLAEMYVSQEKTRNKLSHMYKYENWTVYEKNSEKHDKRPYEEEK